MSKHTPGPWTAINTGSHWNNPNIENWIVTFNADGEQIVDHVYEAADAHLISAAPDLLEALVKIKARLEVYLGDERDMAQSSMQLCLDYAETALAKARSQS